MPNTSHYIAPERMMNTDLSATNMDVNDYSFALNATIEGKSGNGYGLQNEMSNHCSVNFPPNYRVVGFVEVPEQHRTLYALVSLENGNSQIGEATDCVFTDGSDKISKTVCVDCPEYTATENPPLEKQKEHCYCQYRVLAEGCLNFDINYPVDIEYKITNCAFNIYFTDYLSERRFLYFDYTDNTNLESPLKLQDQFKVLADAPTGGLCACPSGYIYNVDDNNCTKQIQTPLTLSNDLRTTCHASDGSYTNFGVAIYNTFSVNGTGTSTVYHTTDTYWSNPTANSTDGVLNRVALWACGADDNPQATDPMLPTNEYIGFIYPVNLLATKTYYVAVAGDNAVRIRLDCVDIVNMDPNAVGAQYSIGPEAAFKYWHVYPVTIPAGHHVIELTGLNYGNVAGFGAEIYDNTKAQIIASTNGTGLNIVFSTADMIGTQLQVSNTFSGTCPDGTCIDFDTDHNLVCTSVDTISPVCDPCADTIVTDVLDCSKTKFHPDYERPCVAFQEFVNGGNLREGSYQVLLAYADKYGNPTSNYLPGTPIVPLDETTIKFETNNVTNKALHFSISNLKSSGLFQYYNIVIAQTIDSFTEFILVGTFSTTQHTYTYTGFEKAPIKLAPTEVFFKRPYYQLAKGVTTANDYLFFSGVKEYKLLNLQPVANRITLQWETVALKEKAYRGPRNTFYFRTYQRDEVYPFAIIFEFANGRDTCAFHIPGRIANEADLDIIDNDDVITDVECGETIRNLRWQVYNTGAVVGGDLQYNETCEIDKCWQFGDFAYWESTETYPNDRTIWGDLCGQPIRFHKFPDSCVTHIHDGNTLEDRPFSQNNYIFPIGVRIDHESVLDSLAQAVTDGLITQAERDSITSYRIVRGNRVGNKSIDAKGLLFNMQQYTKFGTTYYFPNYPYNDLRADDLLDDVSNTTQRYTFHSPDTHFVNAALGNILKVETEEYGKSEGYFTYSDCQAKQKFLSTFARTLAFGLGIAAALSATGKKECKTITYRADDIQQAYTVDASGNAPYGNVIGSSPGATSTTPASAPWNGTNNVPNVTVKHNQGSYTTFDPVTGLPTGFAAASDETITTCKGQTFQIFNSNPEIVALFANATTVIQDAYLGIVEMGKIIDTITALIPYVNYSIQYNSVGKYNNYSCVEEGLKVRKLDKTAYLEPIIQQVDEVSNDPTTAFTTVKVNNWERESSVYLKTKNILDDPDHLDDSKVSMSSNGFSSLSRLDERFFRQICSYYVSVKRNVLNQYGQICNINYIETSPCSFDLNKVYTACEAKVFGGDTFINRFALKRKLPFFQHTMCGLPDGSDILYRQLSNVGSPKYYFNTAQPLGERLSGSDLINPFSLFGDLIGLNDKNYDITDDKVFNQNGVIHLFNYGVPYFLVESDINVDYRHGQNNLEKDFYPHNTDLKQWLEEKYVPIKEDNTFFYNRTYSKQNTESTICASCLTFEDLKCQPQDYNKLIYSEPTSTEDKNDNWLIFKANNNHNFPLKLGRLISADGIENDKVLVRLEKGVQMFPAYNTIQATEQNIQVGTGGLFKNFPQDIAVTTLGYAGTQHRDIKHTEFGHIWADAERGQIFNLSLGGNGGVEELTRYGNKNWFKENLPFNIRKDFTNIALQDIDNNFKGLGLHYCFDKRFSRILITKLDYKRTNPHVLYNSTTKNFYIINSTGNPVTVSLKDTKYFCNKSWTASFNFEGKKWIYHSYTPNFYVQHVDFFESAFTRVNTQHMYAHDLSNKSYQVFYGKLYPFVIEVLTKNSPTVNVINDVEFNLDVIRYHNEFDAFYNRTKTFNKALIYNNHQTSGWLNLVVNNPENLTLQSKYPQRTQDGINILVTNSEDAWRINDFFDVSINQLNNIPLFTYDCNNVNKQLNLKAVNYDKVDIAKQPIRNRVAKIRLVNDIESNYNFIFNFAQVNQNQSYR